MHKLRWYRVNSVLRSGTLFICVKKERHMDYKDTLNMPNTEFEMRGNLAKKEPDILKQ